jgi:hypothetical protein
VAGFAKKSLKNESSLGGRVSGRGVLKKINGSIREGSILNLN